MMNQVSQEKTRSNIPNKAFDLEYSTQFKREMMYLKDHGFHPTFIKKTKDYQIPTYKYTKTPELFIAVAHFYEELRNEKAFTSVKDMMAKGVPIESPEFNEVVNKVVKV